MSKSKKMFLALVAVCLMGTMFFGISGALAKPTLTVWTWYPGYRDHWIKWAEEFNKQYPKQAFELDISLMPHYDMHDKALTALMTGYGAPDIIDIEISRYGPFIPFLQDLMDLANEYRDKMIKKRLDTYTYQGKCYGIPWHVGATVTYYNKSVYDQAGVDLDSIITYDDYISAGKKVTKDIDGDGKIDQWATVVASRDTGPWISIIQQKYSGLFDKEGNCTLDNEINVKALQMLQDFVYKHKIARLSPGGSYEVPEFFSFFNAEKCVSLMRAQWYMIRMKDHMPDLAGKIVIRPLPAWEAGGARSASRGGTGTAITIQCEDKLVDLAKKFIGFAKMTKAGSMDVWYINLDPARKDVYTDPYFVNLRDPYYSNELVAKLIGELIDQGGPLYIAPLITKAVDKLDEEVLPGVFEEQGSAEELLSKLAEKIRAEQK